MRKPKHKRVRAMRRDLESDVTHDFSTHAPSDTFVRVSVTETESTFEDIPDGSLIIDLERQEGTVVVRWTGEDNKPKSMVLTRKGG